MRLKLLGVSGSMRETSHGLRALRLVLEAAADRGAETSMLDLRLADLPMYNPDAPPAGPSLHVPHVTARVSAADWMSPIGLSPATVIVSSTLPTFLSASTVDVTEPAAVTVFPLVRFSAGEPPELSTDAPGSTVSVSPVAAPALKPLASAPVQDTIPPLGAGSGRQAPRTGE